MAVMPRTDRALSGAPAAVVRFQDAMAAPSRVAVIQHLMGQQMTFNDLFAAVGDTQARPTLYSALNDLIKIGYVADDEPEPVRRKRSTTLFTANRTLVVEDMAATFVYLAG
jgi:hypothetical protein